MCSFSVHRGSLIKGEKTGGSEEGWSGGGVERGEGWSVVGEGWSGGVQGGVEGVRGVLTLLVTISGWRGANLGGGGIREVRSGVRSFRPQEEGPVGRRPALDVNTGCPLGMRPACKTRSNEFFSNPNGKKSLAVTLMINLLSQPTGIVFFNTHMFKRTVCSFSASISFSF